MDKILVIDFGSQFSHLIVRRIRDLGVYAEVVPDDISPDEITIDESIKGLILSGGAMSVYDKNSPTLNKEIFTLNIPILGICYGHQLIAKAFGGHVLGGTSGEYGPTKINLINKGTLFSKLKQKEVVWMNHKDSVETVPKGFKKLAVSSSKNIAAIGNTVKHIYSVQFHPEVSHTKSGDRILRNFVEITKAKKTWTSSKLAKDIVKEAKETIGKNKAIIGLSGGIDSTVASVLVGKAIGRKLTAVYVDTGLMRYKETERLRESFKDANLKLIVVNAREIFFSALRGVTDPEKKRKIIGKAFIDIFTEIAEKEQAKFLIQGTIYSDRIESGASKHSSKIKSHHNVGGLPKKLKIKLYEPLRDLYKDEVRKLGKQSKVSERISKQQVFPGPGLAIRIIGEVTPQKVEIVRKAGHIIESELRDTKYWKRIWMSFPVLLSIKSVGVQGDKRSYKYPIVVRVIESRDAMTANFSALPFNILETISTRITNEIKEVNRVVYDITHKPPATMEWE